MNKIPNYALYGETAQPVWHESLHVESISKRSGAHNWEIAAHRHDGLLQLLYLQSGSGEVLFDSELVQVHAPAHLRGRLVGLFNMAANGLRAFSGITVGFLGSMIGVHWSLALSALALLAVTSALLAFSARTG